MRAFNVMLENIMVFLIFAIPIAGFMVGAISNGFGTGIVGLLVGLMTVVFAFGIISPLLEIAKNTRESLNGYNPVSSGPSFPISANLNGYIPVEKSPDSYSHETSETQRVRQMRILQKKQESRKQKEKADAFRTLGY